MDKIKDLITSFFVKKIVKTAVTVLVGAIVAKQPQLAQAGVDLNVDPVALQATVTGLIAAVVNWAKHKWNISWL